jgi:hypothetical protein
MRNLFKLTLIISIFGAIYYFGERAYNIILTENHAMANSALLFEYGILIGCILLITFIVLVQQSNYQKLIEYKPIFGKIFLRAYHLISLFFSISVFIVFEIQRTVIVALSFLLVTAIFEVVRDKILQVMQGNVVRPKKIL